jgi:poly-gamma-glutamate synthesis protein (capsule biosynthesis protein)
MQIIEGRSKNRHIWLFIIVFAIILSIVITLFLYEYGTSPFIPENKSLENEVKIPQPKSASSNVLFLGNTFWGRYINDWSMLSSLKYGYPFSRLDEFDRASYDAWISGIECPIVAGVDMTSAEMDQTLTFNCSPDYLPEAAKWFTAFTLANNHTDNQGIEGFAETKQHLDESGIQYFGHYDPRVIEDNCEIIGLPVTITLDDDSTSKGSLPVAMCGYHAVFRVPTEEAVAEMQKYSPYMPVIAMPHMGVEYQTAPDQLKISIYQSLIDNGADFVLGDHPHWIQNTEAYDGHLIVYSMGNFMFDQQDTSEVVRSAGIRVVFTINGDQAELLNKWLAIGESCKVFKDDCSTQIKQQGLGKLNINYQFGVVGTNDADKIVKPATPEQTNGILDRLNWQSTMEQLHAPYGSL